MTSYKTKICCVIGDPIEHTLSPIIHNKAFQTLDLDFVYVAFRVGENMLEGAVDGMRAFNIRGMNVTIPHKVKVMDYIDFVDEVANDIGAVNTIVNDSGILVGYNSDGEGALRSLVESGISLQGMKVLILGAGGAARAVIYSAAKGKPHNIVILNRTKEKAGELADRVSAKTGIPVTAKKLENQSLKDEIRDTDLIINCTSVGMAPDLNGTLVPKNLLRKGLAVMDIVYVPFETRLLKDAREAGAIVIHGVDMFVNQAAFAFEIWTGCKAPVDVMKDVAVEALKG
ncbi:MAG: shikimate dehydrogenase [Nitrososphaeria archaeon]|jgi:shikimate dehydrogenase